MKVLAIDPGIASCGFVVLDNMRPLISGGFFDLDGDVFYRALTISKALQNLAINYKIDLFCMERFFAPHGKNMRNLLFSNYQRGMLDGLLYYAMGFLPVQLVHPLHVKLWVTHNSKAKKDQMMEEELSLLEQEQPAFLKEVRALHPASKLTHVFDAYFIGVIGMLAYKGEYIKYSLPADKKQIIRTIVKRGETFVPPRFTSVPSTILPKEISDEYRS